MSDSKASRTEYMREYMKTYRKENPETMRAIRFRYWTKRVIKELKEKGIAVGD
jgi:hypothetical protein